MLFGYLFIRALMGEAGSASKKFNLAVVFLDSLWRLDLTSGEGWQLFIFKSLHCNRCRLKNTRWKFWDSWIEREIQAEVKNTTENRDTYQASMSQTARPLWTLPHAACFGQHIRQYLHLLNRRVPGGLLVKIDEYPTLRWGNTVILWGFNQGCPFKVTELKSDILRDIFGIRQFHPSGSDTKLENPSSQRLAQPNTSSDKTDVVVMKPLTKMSLTVNGVYHRSLWKMTSNISLICQGILVLAKLELWQTPYCKVVMTVQPTTHRHLRKKAATNDFPNTSNPK